MTRWLTAAGSALTAIGLAMLIWSCSPDESPAIGSDAPPVIVPPASVSVATVAPGPSSSTSLEESVAGVQPVGFTTVTALITEADGEVCEVCVWLADSADERARGLMGVTDLGEPGAMAFVFDDASTGSFYMFQTPTPLSIAWFDTAGAWVGTAEMTPCMVAEPGECELFAPDKPYVLALEAFAGGLEALGVGPGAKIDLIEGTEQLECQTPSS